MNRLICAIGSTALAQIPGLGQLAAASPEPNVTPQQAAQVSPEQVQQAAAHAERSDPSIIDQVSGFYTKHTMVVKALDTAVVTMALQHISRRQSRA